MPAEYAFDLNYRSNTAPQQAPQRQPLQNPKPQLRRVPQQKRSRREMQAQEARTNRLALRLFAFMIVAIALFGLFCNSLAYRTTSRSALEKANRTLSQQQQIHSVLSNEKANLVTADNIDDIAAKLGLVKVQTGSEVYLNLKGENRVRTSQ